jgi:5-methylcytosine-specific restriction protein B
MLKFKELKNWIKNEMKMAPGYNYQPVMICTLVQSGGRATQEKIIEELTGTSKKTKYPFEILTKHNVCKHNESDKTYELLDFDSYSIAEKAWIIVECVLKDKTKKEILEKNVEDVRRRIKNEPKLTEDRDEVLDRYGKMFALDNIKNITKDDFLGFFRYENNHHWKGVNQSAGHLVKDMPRLQESLKIIFDENKTISERIKQLRGDKNGSNFISYLGNALYTPILLVGSNLQYAVINGIVDSALDKLRLFPKKFLPKRVEDEWKIIPLMQEIVSEVAKRYDLDLWQIDWVWWDFSLREERRSYWLVTPGYQSNLKDKMISKNLMSIGFHDVNLLEYFEEKSGQEKSGEFKSTEKKEELKKIVRADTEKQYQKRVLELRKKKKDEGKLSNTEEKELAKKEKDPTKAKVSWNWIPMRDFVKSKINDEVILWNGNNKIFATGRIIGGYQYLKHDIHDQHHHQKQVEWTDTEERDIPDNMLPGGQRPSFVETDKSATALVNWLYGKEQIYQETTSDRSTVPPDPKLCREFEDAGYTKLLEDMLQIIFYGPPGTGKTWTAEKFAECRSQKKKCEIKMVTFHPSYSYEDFVEGFRPDTKTEEDEKAGGNTYKLEPGTFRTMCKSAKEDSTTDYILIIDEINRGNISKIFGELISLMEKDKRGKKVELPYSKDPFSVPENLYIIGTMNTADMSLVQVDTALRRRFGFIELMPDSSLVKNEKYKTILENLNRKIREKKMRDKQIGHSYFMKLKNDEDLQFSFKYKIIPLLQDYFYHDYKILADILGKKIINVSEQQLNGKYFEDNAGSRKDFVSELITALKDGNKKPDEESS